MRIVWDDFARDLPAVSERARTEPVTITRDERDELVLLSAEEYARLRARGRRVEVGPMDDEMAAALQRAEVPPEYAHLDDLLGDWEPPRTA